jgi:molybdopterin-guanine dinucleotide biosynthesis protein A
LLTALEICDSEYAVVLAADLWSVTPVGLASILRAMTDGHPDRLADVAYATTPSGRGQPLCSVWRVGSALEVVRRRVDSGNVSMFGLVDSLHSRAVTLDDAQLRNVNEPQDLELFLHQDVGEG